MCKAFIFPGQGSQYVGMGEDLYKQSDLGKKYYEIAADILGFDLAAISFEGPDKELKQTQFTQPAIFTHSVVIDILLKEKEIVPDAVAGHSLGEFSALVSAEVLTFEDALNIVKVRSEEMAKAGTVSSGTMAAIIGGDEEQIKQICNQDGIVVPANLNAPGQVVISGDENAVTAAIETAKEIGIRRALALNVSGAFHSPLMAPAREPLSKVLNSVNFRDAKVPVYQNVTAMPIITSQEIKQNILDQLEKPVLWSKIITNMVGDGFNEFYEPGPGKILQGLNRRICPNSPTQSFGKLDQLVPHEV